MWKSLQILWPSLRFFKTLAIMDEKFSYYSTAHSSKQSLVKLKVLEGQ